MTTHLLAAAAAPPGSGVALGASTTVAVVLAIITGISIWKRASARACGWLALLTGLTGAPIVLSWLGGLAGLSVYGVGILTVAAIGGALICWHELVRQRGLHRWRTPAIALLTGAALMSVTGVAGGLAHAVSNVTTTTVTRVTGTATGH